MASTNSEVVCLNEYLVKPQCFCLNQNPSFPFTNLFVGDETLFLRSDVDGFTFLGFYLYLFLLEQLLINLVFRTTVKITAVKFAAPDDGKTGCMINSSLICADSAPSSAKLYINMQNPGFSDVEDLEPTQKVPLSAADFDADTKTPLKVVKFQRVNRFYFDFVVVL